MTEFDFEVGPNDGFKVDRFRRKEFGEHLENAIVNARMGATIALDAPWGAGKSVFLKQFAGHLRAKGWIVAEYDAFSWDYEDDPFIPLIASLLNALPANEKTKRKRILDNSIPLAKRILAGSIRSGAKLISAGFLDTKELGEAVESAITSEVDLLGNSLSDRILKIQERDKELQSFREAIDEASKLTEKSLSRNAQVLIIVDELDRCRPEFAVKTLERIKHLFAGAQCSFLFGVNTPELAAIVKGYYGEEFSGRKYLQRFFDMEFSFPPNRRNTAPSTHLQAISSSETSTNILTSWMEDLLENRVLRFEPSLRDIERLVARGRNISTNGVRTDSECVLFTLLHLIQVCRPDELGDLVSVPTSRESWNRLVFLELLDREYSNGNATFRDLIWIDETEYSQSEGTKNLELLRSSFPLVRTIEGSDPYRGIINAYADIYLTQGETP